MKLYLKMLLVTSVLCFLLLCTFDLFQGVYLYHDINVVWKVNAVISLISAFASSTFVNIIEVWNWIGKQIGAI